MLLQGSGSASSDASLDTAPSPSSATWALNLLCSCRLEDGAGVTLLVWEVTGFQPLPSWKSSVSTDLVCPSLNAVRGSGSWRSFSQCLSHDLCCCAVCWLPTAALVDYTDPSPVHTSYRQEAHLPQPQKEDPVIPAAPGHSAASFLRSSVWVELSGTLGRAAPVGAGGPCSAALHHHHHTYTLCTAEPLVPFCAYCINSCIGVSLAPTGRVLGAPKSGVSWKQKTEITLWLRTEIVRNC